MNYDDVYAAFKEAAQEIFRLEVQQSYAGVPDADWDAWQAGKGLEPINPDMQKWYDAVTARAAAGVRQHRVLVVDEPLDPYLHYELRRSSATSRRANGCSSPAAPSTLASRRCLRTSGCSTRTWSR